MSRRFKHLGQEWGAEGVGGGHGTGFGHPPAVTEWNVVFRCLSESSRGPYYGRTLKPDPAQVSEDDLKRSLDAAIAKAGTHEHKGYRITQESDQLRDATGTLRMEAEGQGMGQG